MTDEPIALRQVPHHLALPVGEVTELAPRAGWRKWDAAVRDLDLTLNPGGGYTSDRKGPTPCLE